MNPLRVFVYKDGLARFATEPYQVPSKRNLDQICMHLTNYAINKNSKDFIRDDEKGSKRTIQAVLDELESKNGIDKDTIWKKIQDVVVKTILIVQPALSRLVKPWFPTDQKSSFNHFGSQCFEILGFDILLDSKLKPWVLEVNHSPSFTCDALLDKEIKSGVIKDALNLLSLNSSSPKRYLRDQKAKSLNRLLKSQKGGSLKSKGTPTQDTISSKGALNDIGSSEITLNNSQTDLLSNEAEENATNCNSKTSEKRLELQKKSLERYYRKYNPAILKKFEEWENSRLGNYDRVFPPDDPSLLSKYTYLMEETSQFSTETNSTKIRKAFLETKIQEEISKSRRLTQWKAKQQQKTNHISAKVSTTQNKLANFQANLSMTHILTLKRADYAYQLHQDAGCISPTPTSLSAVGSAKKYKQTIDVKIQNLSDCFVKPSDRFHFLKPPVQSRSTGPKKVVNYADLLSMNPLIKAKQLELTMTKTEVHNRRRNHRQSLYQIPFSP
ncbi:Tubulin polyglutamylase ttll6 [Globomyces sp. JEL0801]|nr:Tubulin polyglutamylase ttll6 [Globomyces sp. JEL0801]